MLWEGKGGGGGGVAEWVRVEVTACVRGNG